MIRFNKGDPNEPTGNLLVYCHVEGRNPFHEDARYIISNIVVSFISAPSNSFPVVIFPPGPAYSEEELLKIIALNPAYDVLRVHDYNLPEGHDEGTYIKERMEHLNECVMEYVELCQRNIESRLEEDDFDLIIDSIDLSDFNEERDSHARNENDFAYKTGRGGSGMTRPQQLNEQTALSLLEDWVRTEKTSPANRAPHKARIESALAYLREFPQYDIALFEKAIGRNNDGNELPELYLAKFRAVLEERYETAARLREYIRRMEHDIESKKQHARNKFAKHSQIEGRAGKISKAIPLLKKDEKIEKDEKKGAKKKEPKQDAKANTIQNSISKIVPTPTNERGADPID